jgi:4,5-dihydroxyphthalate decarboxylase
MTAAVFIRGMLTDQYGVDFSGVEWVQGSINAAGRHGNPSAPPLLKKVNIKVNSGGKSLSELIDAGEIDAIIGTDFPRAMRTNKAIGRLFPNFPEVERDYYRATGIYPIMHLVAIRRELCERHPFIASSLYQASCKAKDIALERLRFPGALATMMPWTVADRRSKRWCGIWSSNPGSPSPSPSKASLFRSRNSPRRGTSSLPAAGAVLLVNE